MLALVDCNNFYASCERLFRPDLADQSILILSNNDGCIIARSNEAKALGLKMGEPFFKVRALCKQHQVNVFSSNYTLYGDLSDRVMRVIQDSWPQAEIYSIDEAFLDLSTMSPDLIDKFCMKLQQNILQYTGIPTSIGIGPTKTLAKLANHTAKNKLSIPVFNITNQRDWLDKIAVGDVWGVGHQGVKKFNSMGIHTAKDLTHLDYRLARKKFGVSLLRTIMELNGQPCLSVLDTDDVKKSIISSCSFGALQTDYQALTEAISFHCATAWGKLRKHELRTQHLSIFIRSNPFRQDLEGYTNSVGFRLIHRSDDIRYLTRAALLCLKQIYKPGIYYHKCGVIFTDLVHRNQQQLNLFDSISPAEQLKSCQVMALMDSINEKYGQRTIRLAAEGVQQSWLMKRKIKTPNYTTRWSDLPIVYAR